MSFEICFPFLFFSCNFTFFFWFEREGQRYSHLYTCTHLVVFRSPSATHTQSTPMLWSTLQARAWKYDASVSHGYRSPVIWTITAASQSLPWWKTGVMSNSWESNPGTWCGMWVSYTSFWRPASTQPSHFLHDFFLLQLELHYTCTNWLLFSVLSSLQSMVNTLNSVVSITHPWLYQTGRVNNR